VDAKYDASDDIPGNDAAIDVSEGQYVGADVGAALGIGSYRTGCVYGTSAWDMVWTPAFPMLAAIIVRSSWLLD